MDYRKYFKGWTPITDLFSMSMWATLGELEIIRYYHEVLLWLLSHQNLTNGSGRVVSFSGIRVGFGC